MTTRIGLVSDVHASPKPLRQALQIFEQTQVDDIICVGDIAGYYDRLQETVELLIEANCQAVIGNHDQTYLAKPSTQDDAKIRGYLQELPLSLQLEIEGCRILVVHANPPAQQHGGIKLLDPQGAFIAERIELWSEQLKTCACDILIVGHTHQVYALHLGNTLLINPGSSVFNHSCMILQLPEMTVETFALEDREIVSCWNFSMLYS